MSILSLKFLAFISVVILVFYLLPQKMRWILLLCASMGFYLMSGIRGTVYLLAVSFITWFFALKIGKLYQQKTDAELNGIPALSNALKRLARVWLCGALLLVIGAMIIIKFNEPFRLLINALLRFMNNRTHFDTLNVLVPLGLSYFTFQSVGYVIDVYWGKTEAQPNFFKHLLFVSYFPQIIQGPISTHEQLGQQLLEPKPFNPLPFTMGFQLMMWGYFKKMVFADRLASFTNAVAVGEGQQGWLILLGVIGYILRLYADFSGGMDVVRGVSMMLGVELIENFRRPFFSCSVAEYWRRWHISLGSWLRNYVLFPLTISRMGALLNHIGQRILGKKSGRMLPGAVATFLTFLLIGLWHGASWNAVVFGAYFGLLVGLSMLLEPLFKSLRKKLRMTSKNRWWRSVFWFRTMVLILLAQYFVFTTDVKQGLMLLANTLTPWNFTHFAATMIGFMPALEWIIAGLSLALIFLVDVLCECHVDVNGKLARTSFLLRWPVMLTLIMIIVIFGHYGEGFDSTAFFYTTF